MKRAIDFFAGKHNFSSTIEALRTRNLAIVDLFLLCLLICLIPLSVLAGEIPVASILPACAITILYSLFLIKHKKNPAAVYITILTCSVAISLGLFLGGELPGPSLAFRGILLFLVLIAAVPLISMDSFMPLKTGALSLLILQLFFWTRLYSPLSPVPEIPVTLLIASILLPVIASILGYAASLNLGRLMTEEDNRSNNLERLITERTADLEASASLLRESESRYRSIVENSHDGIMIVDDDYTISFYNDEILSLSGYSPDEVRGRNFLEFVDEKEKNTVLDRFQRRQSGDAVPSIYNIGLKTKSGIIIQGEVRVVIHSGLDGKKKTVVRFLDTTRQREAEELLKRQYDLAVSLSGVDTLDDALDIIMSEVRELDGVDCGGIYSMDSVTGSMDLVCHWGLSETFISAVSHLEHDVPQVKILYSDEPARISQRDFEKKLPDEMIQLLRGEGFLTLTSIPVRYREVIIAALNCASRTVEDFTDRTRHQLEAIAGQVGTLIARLRAEKAIRESEEKYRLLLEGGNNIVISADECGIVTYISPSIAGITGYVPEEIIGHPFLSFIFHEDLPLITKKYAEVMQGILSPDEYRIVTKNGEPRWIISNSRPIIENGIFTGIIGIFTDITWRKQAEDERFEMERRLLHAQKLESIGVLAGGIAHDFNNILMAIMGNLELASTTLPPTAAHRIHVNEAIRASRRAADLVRQMLDYSGSGSILRTEANLSEIVEETSDLLRASISKNARLILDLAHPIHAIIADPTQIQQIVMNLIVNASEAIGKSEGVITVSSGEIECDDSCLRLSCLDEKPAAGRFAFLEVRDTGSGMDDTTLCKIFDPFYTTKFAGRGLGLAAVLGIVRSHGGAIMVSSSPGNGTSIKALFPLTESLAKTALPDETHPGVPADKETAGTILVIDDDEMILRTARAMLERLGYRVLTAPGGREALEIVRRYKDEIDCSIVDLTMQGIDGRETIVEMRKIKPDMKSILSSGYHRDDVMGKMGDDFPDGFIQKPYHLRELEDEINRLKNSIA